MEPPTANPGAQRLGPCGSTATSALAQSSRVRRASRRLRGLATNMAVPLPNLQQGLDTKGILRACTFFWIYCFECVCIYTYLYIYTLYGIFGNYIMGYWWDTNGILVGLGTTWRHGPTIRATGLAMVDHQFGVDGLETLMIFKGCAS